jgi:polysaccharide pyruvyl transferase WcaK-like protein
MNYTKNINRKLFYRFLASFLIGKTQHRRAPCFFKKNGLVLNYNGELYECSRFETPVVDFFEENKSVVSVKSTTFKRTQSEHEQCTACFHDQNGYWPINSIIREIANKFLAKFFKLAIFMKYFCLFLKNEYLTPQCRLQPVGNDILIIGMYGGEHVGDAAILGGVIDRIKTQHTINKIYVSSFRVDRTKCWAANLTFQNDIEVIGYSLKEIASVLKSTKFVLWGGGPIMDLPNLLMHHLSVVSLTKKSNVPLLIEGVGIGPIKSKICGFLVKHILKRSAAITVRTTNDQSFLKSFSNKKSTVIGDPAFIYLKNVDFLALSDKSYQYIEPLVRMFENRRIIGLNIRPLWEKYSTICIDEIKNRYIVEIKNASNTLIDKGYAVIFFAMNADQYGFSDLSFGHELAGNVKSEYFKVLDYENTIESAIYLINKCHAIVSSRFHACIFAISQRKPIIGIDYSIGKPGKISYLLNEYSMSDRIIRVEEINGDVISKKVQEI